MEKKKMWGKLHRIRRRVLSLFMALTMLFTMGQTCLDTSMSVRAATAVKNVKLHFQNEWNWSEPALQFWGGSSTNVAGEKSGPTEITGWGGAQGYTLTEEENGFFSIQLTGDFEGFQFLDMTENADGSHNSTNGVGYDSKMEQYTGETPTDLYYLFQSENNAYAWYTDAEGTQVIPEIAGVEDCSVTVHFYNDKHWSNVNAYMGEGASWTPIAGYENYKEWPGAAIMENENHTGWYDLTLQKKNDTRLYCIFNDGNGSQTSNIEIDLAGKTSYEAWYIDETMQIEAPDIWMNPPEEETPKEDEPVVTPTTESGNVSDHVVLQVKEKQLNIQFDMQIDMQLYKNGIYEVPLALPTGTYTASALVNGVEKAKLDTVAVAEERVVYFRLNGNTFTDSINTPGMVHTAAFTGEFASLKFVDEQGESFGITNWSPQDTAAELAYLGGGLYKRTFLLDKATQQTVHENVEYKVAFDDGWEYALGNGGSNISVTIPAGTEELTVFVDEINGMVYDSIRTGTFTSIHNAGNQERNAFATPISLIGTARESSSDWDEKVTGYEFTPISDTLYRYQKTFAAGEYAYKCIFNYKEWYEAESGNRDLLVKEDNTRVVILYDTVSGKLYDSINNEAEMAIMLGMKAAPAEMEVVDNANGSTKFIALAADGSNVTLFYGNKNEVETSGVAALKTASMEAAASGEYHSKDFFFGDEALDIVYYYDVDGNRILDGSNATVSVKGAEYSNYTRNAFTGRTVNVAGTFPGPSWDATSNVMTYKGNGLYMYTFSDVPAANYEFKIAFNSWDPENYGAGGVKHGSNIAVTVPTTQDVSVYYNDFSHLAVTTVDYVFADVSLYGTGIAEGTKLTDEELTGIYSATVTMEAGNYSDIEISYDNRKFPFAEFTVDKTKDVTFYFDPLSEVYYNNASDVKVETNHIYYTSKETAYKSVYGAVATAEDVTFGIETGTDASRVLLIAKGIENKSLVMEKDGTAKAGVQKWSVSTKFAKAGEYDYYFVISNGSSVCIYADDDGYYGEGIVTDLTNILPYDLVVYEDGFETPDWMKDAVIYQIFPDRFYDGDTANDFAVTSARGEVDYEYITDWYMLPENPEQKGKLSKEDYEAAGAYYGDGNWSNEIYGGDVAGIIDQIDYLKALGVNVIYLNPVFASISSHRYDTSDYRMLDPVLGNQGDFAKLVKAAEENDMHIILDGVFNHVSDDSIYFDRYYKYLEAGTDTIGAYPYWAYVYDYMSEKGVKKEQAQAAARTYFSTNYGIKDFSYAGWFDVYQTTLKDDQGMVVTDGIGLRAGKAVYGYEGWWGYDSMPVIMSTNGSEYQTGNWAEDIIYDKNGNSVTQYWLSEGSNGWRLDVANEVSDETWQKFRDSVKALDSDAVIVGEIWDDATKYLMGDMYDSVMNYVFRGAVLDFAKGGSAEGATNTLEKIKERYPAEAFYAMMNLVGSHDTTRVLSYLDGIDDDRKQTDIKSAFPTYETTSDLAKQRQYLVALLQFTYAGAPTIYYGDEIGMVGADDPDDRRGFTWGAGNEELVTWYASLAEIRKNYEALRTGEVTPFVTNDSVMSYVRSDNKNQLIVLANNASKEQSITLNLEELNIAETELTDLIQNTKYVVENKKVTVVVPAYRGVILTADAKTITVNKGALAPAYDATYQVAERVLAKEIKLDKNSVSIKEGESAEITAIITPANTTDHTVIWSSSNESVATVDANGRITGVAAGKAVIYGKAAFSPENISAACKVTVAAKEDSTKQDEVQNETAGTDDKQEHNSGSTGNANSAGAAVVIQGKIVFDGKAQEETFRKGNQNYRRLKSTNGTDFSIEGVESIIPTGANFTVKGLDAGNAQYQKAQNAVAQNAAIVKFVAYEIDLWDSSLTQMHQLTGYVNVTMPVPEQLGTGTGNRLMVYRLEDDGSLTRCNTSVSNGKLTFATNHFSTFVIAEESKTAPQTSDANAVRLYLSLLLLTVGAAFLYVARKKRSK